MKKKKKAIFPLIKRVVIMRKLFNKEAETLIRRAKSHRVAIESHIKQTIFAGALGEVVTI